MPRVLDRRGPFVRATVNVGIAYLYVFGFFGVLTYYMLKSFEFETMPDNPILNMMMGAMTTGLALVLQWLYRSSSPPPVIDTDVNKNGIPDSLQPEDPPK